MIKGSFGRREGPPQEELGPELTPEEEEKLNKLRGRQEEIQTYMKAGAGNPEDRVRLRELEAQIAEIELRGLKQRVARLEKEHPGADTRLLRDRIEKLEPQRPSPGNGGEGNGGGRAA